MSKVAESHPCLDLTSRGQERIGSTGHLAIGKYSHLLKLDAMQNKGFRRNKRGPGKMVQG